MKFKTKYMITMYLLDALSWVFSLTILLVIYVKIKEARFESYTHWIYPRADLSNPKHLEIVNDSFNKYIWGLYVWIPATLSVDVGIRKLLRYFAN